MSTTSSSLSSWGSWEQGGELFILVSVRIPSANVICCTRLMWLVFLTVLFCFFFHTYSPCILVLVFTGLFLASLDVIKISGFVFSCRAMEWASLLLNSAAYALATCICISMSALQCLCEHGPLLHEAVCCARNALTLWI